MLTRPKFFTEDAIEEFNNSPLSHPSPEYVFHVNIHILLTNNEVYMDADLRIQWELFWDTLHALMDSDTKLWNKNDMTKFITKLILFTKECKRKERLETLSTDFD